MPIIIITTSSSRNVKPRPFGQGKRKKEKGKTPEEGLFPRARQKEKGKRQNPRGRPLPFGQSKRKREKGKTPEECLFLFACCLFTVGFLISVLRTRVRGLGNGRAALRARQKEKGKGKTPEQGLFLFACCLFTRLPDPSP
jgi:hypothetical protein